MLIEFTEAESIDASIWDAAASYFYTTEEFYDGIDYIGVNEVCRLLHERNEVSLEDLSLYTYLIVKRNTMMVTRYFYELDYYDKAVVNLIDVVLTDYEMKNNKFIVANQTCIDYLTNKYEEYDYLKNKNNEQ